MAPIRLATACWPATCSWPDACAKLAGTNPAPDTPITKTTTVPTTVCLAFMPLTSNLHCPQPPNSRFTKFYPDRRSITNPQSILRNQASERSICLDFSMLILHERLLRKRAVAGELGRTGKLATVD